MTQSLISAIDAEISRLEEARKLLLGQTAGRGNGHKPRGGKRHLTEDGRRRIAAAVRKRWAAQKRAAK